MRTGSERFAASGGLANRQPIKHDTQRKTIVEKLVGESGKVVADILAKIIATKWEEIASAKKVRGLDELKSVVLDTAAPRDFLAALQGSPPIRLIAEVKKASPSAGLIRDDFDPVAIARAYASGGASCLSVLTDQVYFQGRLEYLAQIRNAVNLPLLRKDFIVDPYQVYEARAAGADAILLIAECLAADSLQRLYDLAIELQMSVLIELHDPANLDKVLATGTQLVGVNNRDLHSFQVDTQRTVTLRKQIDPSIVVVGESGVHDRDLVLQWQEAGVNAMLVGETLMRKADIQTAVRELLGTG